MGQISKQQLVYKCRPGQGIMADKYYAFQVCYRQLDRHTYYMHVLVYGHSVIIKKKTHMGI